MIIGLAGKKRVGKSTAAQALQDSGFVILSFSHTIKLLSKILLRDIGLTEQQFNFAEGNK